MSSVALTRSGASWEMWIRPCDLRPSREQKAPNSLVVAAQDRAGGQQRLAALLLLLAAAPRPRRPTSRPPRPCARGRARAGRRARRRRRRRRLVRLVARERVGVLLEEVLTHGVALGGGGVERRVLRVLHVDAAILAELLAHVGVAAGGGVSADMSSCPSRAGRSPPRAAAPPPRRGPPTPRWAPCARAGRRRRRRAALESNSGARPNCCCANACSGRFAAITVTSGAQRWPRRRRRAGESPHRSLPSCRASPSPSRTPPWRAHTMSTRAFDTAPRCPHSTLRPRAKIGAGGGAEQPYVSRRRGDPRRRRLQSTGAAPKSAAARRDAALPRRTTSRRRPRRAGLKLVADEAHR